jgi:hypothetical protein
MASCDLIRQCPKSRVQYFTAKTIPEKLSPFSRNLRSNTPLECFHIYELHIYELLNIRAATSDRPDISAKAKETRHAVLPLHHLRHSVLTVGRAPSFVRGLPPGTAIRKPARPVLDDTGSHAANSLQDVPPA